LPQFKKAEEPFEKARAVTTRLMRSMLGVISHKILRRNQDDERAVIYRRGKRTLVDKMEEDSCL
jgi:hypothetical protein